MEKSGFGWLMAAAQYGEDVTDERAVVSAPVALSYETLSGVERFGASSCCYVSRTMMCLLRISGLAGSAITAGGNGVALGAAFSFFFFLSNPNIQDSQHVIAHRASIQIRNVFDSQAPSSEWLEWLGFCAHQQ